MQIQTGETNPILRKKCPKVEVFDADLEKLVIDMEETMLTPDPKTGIRGIGLAAPQVGIDARVVLITQGLESRRPKVISMVNPEIIEFSKETVVMEEGCLSLPEVFEKLARPRKIKVRWQNLKGNVCERKFEGWEAREIQHEVDHLDGILFTDYLKKENK